MSLGVRWGACVSYACSVHQNGGGLRRVTPPTHKHAAALRLRYRTTVRYAHVHGVLRVLWRLATGDRPCALLRTRVPRPPTLRSLPAASGCA